MNVNNNGDTPLTGITPAALNITGSTGQIFIMSGPSPSSVANLAVGAITSFTWVYDVYGPGTLSVDGTASGNAGATLVTSPSSISAAITLLALPTLTETPIPSVTVTPSYTATPLNTATNVNTATQTSTVIPAGTATVTSTLTPVVPTPGTVLVFVTATPMVIWPNPNATPGIQPTRVISYNVSRPISKTEFRIYTSMGRLIRQSVDNTARLQGKCIISVNGEQFEGLAKGIYYYVIMVTDAATSKEVKSSIGKVVIQ
jgi:hypothetical protein